MNNQGFHILILNRRDIKNPKAGGAEVYIHEVAKRLVSFCNVIMFSSAFSNSITEEEIDGIKIIRKGSEFTVYVMAMWYYFVRFRKSTDLVIECKDGGIPWLTKLYAARPKLALVHQTGRSINTPFIQSTWYFELHRIIGFFIYLLEPLLMKAYTGMTTVVVSESTRRDLEAMGVKPKHVAIIEPGFTEYGGHISIENSVPAVIYLGRIKRSKGVEDVIRAFSVINSEIPDSVLILIGSGDSEYVDQLIELSKNLDVYERLDFRGHISEQEKIDVLRSAKLMLLPSVREGWGITVMEANYFGIPVIGYDVPGLRDSIRNELTGVLVPYGDYVTMGELAIELLRDADKWNRYSNNAIKWARRFSWERTARKFAEIIAHYLPESPRHLLTNSG